MPLNPQFLPKQALYGTNPSTPDGSTASPWRLSPEPFALGPALLDSIKRLGPVLNHFVGAMDTLYADSLNPKHSTPAWVADYLNLGKPPDLIQFAQMKRFKAHRPVVLRPDLLLTGSNPANNDEWVLTELDSVPGGLGFTAALAQAYHNSGCVNVLQGQATQTMPQAFLQALTALAPTLNQPIIAVVVSAEASDYWAEWSWLVETLQATYPNIVLLHPQQLDWHNDRLVYTHQSDERRPIDILYRFFELFDRPNIPKLELIQYAIKKGKVLCTPPFKPHHEEKLWLALLHHPVLAQYWASVLGAEPFDWLRQRVPQSWILDPSPLPPHATIHGLRLNQQAVQSFSALKALSQAQRQWVIKPSGFSPLAWGSRGVSIGHDMSLQDWGQRVDDALATFPQSPHILQPFHKPASHSVSYWNDDNQQLATMQARTRLCPYFMVTNDQQVSLTGILATHCQANKKIIHGMQGAILAPCSAL
jgi:hypothetical protein